jgi:hypothetical protein
MLTSQTFTKDRLDAKAKAAGAVNAQIFERCVHALELVGRLAEAKLDFIFKGGTSLILHLEPVRRLFVDVDIAWPRAIMVRPCRASAGINHSGSPQIPWPSNLPSSSTPTMVTLRPHTPTPPYQYKITF